MLFGFLSSVHGLHASSGIDGVREAVMQRRGKDPEDLSPVLPVWQMSIDMECQYFKICLGRIFALRFKLLTLHNLLTVMPSFLAIEERLSPRFT